MEDVMVVESENNRILGDKPEVDKMAKDLTGNVIRKKLGDISNLPQQRTQVEKSQFIAATTKEYIDQLKKENMTLMKLLADRNKIIELSGVELQKMSVNLQKVQLQNLQLAQSNSHMLAELNSGKDRLKALHHELGCTNGLLKAKELVLKENIEVKVKARTKTCQKIDNECVNVEVSKCEVALESMELDIDDKKPCSTKRRQHSKSLGPSTVKQVQVKEEKDENKRVCVKRQSARFKSEESRPTEDLLEIAEAKLRSCPLNDDQMQEDGSTAMSSLGKLEDKDGSSAPISEPKEFSRLSIGRPLRQAAKKVQSYKETPVNVKMRRPE